MHSFKLKVNIHLISTVHTEKGGCTAESLFNILNTIKPDVVFGESSSEMFESFKKELIQSSLELNAIEKLSQYHSFSFVAIDTYPALNANSRYQVNVMFDSIAKDKEHSIAWRRNNENTRMNGFDYLNSEESIEIFNAMATREKAIVEETTNLNYKSIYTEWLNFHDARENEMLDNINFYVENNELEKAVFLCGSAHRESIINKIKEKNDTQVRWNFELPK